MAQLKSIRNCIPLDICAIELAVSRHIVLNLPGWQVKFQKNVILDVRSARIVVVGSVIDGNVCSPSTNG